MATKVEIDELVELPDGDGLLVIGTVDGEPAQAQVWKSHLFGDHAAINKQRAADAKRETADSKKAADEQTENTEIEIPKLERSEVLRTDEDRQRYLAEQLVATRTAIDKRAQKLTGPVKL